jgi:hypothetical protein
MALNYDYGGRNEYEDSSPDDLGIGALTQAFSADTIAQDYWAQQAALQQAEWERQAVAQQAEWERQAAARDAITTNTGALEQATTPSNVLSGVILAGDSWLSGDDKTSIANTLFDQPVTNTALGGQKTADVLNQLNVFERDGGTFAPGSTVVLSLGGNDLATGVDRGTITNNLNEIVSRLGAYGVNVVLSAAPNADSYDQAITSTNLQMDNLYNDVANSNSNVTLVDSMSGFLNQKDLMDASGFHLKDDASKTAFINTLEDAYSTLTPLQKTAVANKIEATGASSPVDIAKVVDEVAGTNVAATATDTATAPQATSTIQLAGQSFDVDNTAVTKVRDQILAQGTTTRWTGEGFGSAEANAEAMAKQLVANGVTDINQVGKQTVVVPGTSTFDEQGNETAGQDQTVTQIVNKATGKALINDYGERGGVGDAWSGTYAGKGNTAFRTTFDANGKPIFYTTGASSSDVGDLAPLLAMAQFIPGVAPFAMAINAAIAIDSGDVLGGLASLAGMSGFSDVATGLRVAKAIDQGDMGALAMSLLQNETVGTLAGSTMLTDTISLADAGNAYNAVINVQNGNYAGALTSVGTLTNSADIKTAGAALNLVNALNSGNEVNIINAAAGLNNTIKAADNLSNAAIAKSVATSVSSGADAFVQAKNAGATDADALSAANTVTGTDAGTSVSTTKNTQVVDNRAQNTLVLSNTDADSLDEAAALAISKGNDSFSIGGKTYIVNTATGNLPAAEHQAADSRLVKSYLNSLGKTDTSQLTKDEQIKFLNSYNSYTANGTGVLKSATLEDLLTGNSTFSPAESLANSTYTGPFKVDIAGVGNRGDGTVTTPEVSSVDKAGTELTQWANTLTGPEGDTIRQLISTTSGLVGEQLADLGTAVSQTGLIGRYNGLVKFGQSLEKVGKDLEIPAVTAANKNFWDQVQSQEKYTGKLTAALQAIYDQPLVLVAAAKEVGQEALPFLLGGAAFKYGGKMLGILTDMSANALESMGSNNRQTFNEELAKGTPADQAEKIAERNGIIAGAITMGTAGLVDTALIKSYEKALEKLSGRVVAGAGKEFPEESFEELAIALATGDDLNTALTKSVVGGFTGAKASGTISGISGSSDSKSNVNTELKTAFAEQGLTSSDGTFRPGTITKISDAGTAGTAGGVNTTVTEVAGNGATVTTGADTAAATDFASIFTTTGNTTQAVDASVSTAINNGADVSNTIASVVNAANATGASANVVAATAANAAVIAGADATTASNAATTAVSNVTTGTAATTGATTGTTATTGATTGTAATTGATTGTAATTTGTNAATTTGTNAATTTGTNAATTTGTNAATTTGTNAATTTGTNTNTNTGTDTNTNTSTNTNTGVSTNTTTNTNTGVTTTTTTNTNTGTNTAVSTNTNTGVTTTTNTNTNTGVNTNTAVDTNTNTTTNTVVDTNTDTTTTVQVNTDTGEIVSVDGPGKVIDVNTVVVDGTAIDVTTGEVLTPEEVNKRIEAAKIKLATPKKQTSGAMAGPSVGEPTYKAKDSDIAETWLGGRFRNIAPLAGLSALLPENTPMFQEAQALSALRRASGIEDEAKTPESDYYAYGTEPSFAKVLEPYMNGGTVQKYADGGKMGTSPLMAASGGDVPHKGSHYVQGAGGGQDDLIPAKLADGEYVFDADIVAALGDGSNKEGAKKLDAMREAIRKHKRGGSVKSIPPAAKSPLTYLKGVL